MLVQSYREAIRSSGTIAVTPQPRTTVRRGISPARLRHEVRTQERSNNAESGGADHYLRWPNSDRDQWRGSLPVERDYSDAGSCRRTIGRDSRRGLSGVCFGAAEVAKRARDHVARTEETGTMLTPEQVLLDHLAKLKKAVAGDVDAAPDLARSNVIAICSVSGADPCGQLLRAEQYRDPSGAEIRVWTTQVVTEKGEPTYWLLQAALNGGRYWTPWADRAGDPRARVARSSPTGSCAGTAGGSPRRSRTVQPARPR